MHHWANSEANSAWINLNGREEERVQLNRIIVHEKKKETLKSEKHDIAPFSQLILKENIKLLQRPGLENKNRQHHLQLNMAAVREVYTGPKQFQRLLHAFKFIYSQKLREQARRVRLYKRALRALDQNRHDIGVMKHTIKHLKHEYDGKCTETTRILNQLTLKATQLEKLRAYSGQESPLNAFLQMNEIDANADKEIDENDELLEILDRDELDDEFDAMREESLKNRQMKAREELTKAKETYFMYRDELHRARQQVETWKGLVDRNCIERIRAFQNPPFLVGQIMEMIFVLIGKTLPGMIRLDKILSDQQQQQGGAGQTVGDGSAYGSLGRFSRSGSDKNMLQQGPGSSGKPGMGGAGGGFGSISSAKEEKVDKTLWKHMQLSMSDSVKFVEMLHNIAWEDGLDGEIMKAVELYLAKSKDGQLGVTGEGTLLENAETTTFKAKKGAGTNAAAIASGQQDAAGLNRNLAKAGITISAAKYSSEDSATLVQYAIALVEYTQNCGPLRKSLERIHELEREVAESERVKLGQQSPTNQQPAEDEQTVIGDEQNATARSDHNTDNDQLVAEEKSEADMIQEVSAIQKQYDQAILEKYKLQNELFALEERLKTCQTMSSNFHLMKDTWQDRLTKFSNSESLLINSLICAAYLTYCGPLEFEERKRFAQHFSEHSQNYIMKIYPKKSEQRKVSNIQRSGTQTSNTGQANTSTGPAEDLQSSPILFSNLSLINFLFNNVDQTELARLGLSMTNQQLENACFLMLEGHCNSWPLLCDPSRRAIYWLSKYLSNYKLCITSHNRLNSLLENCLSDGNVLVISDCDVNLLENDRRLRQVLTNQEKFFTSTSTFKLMIGDQEVECHPNFRLFLHTSVLPCQLSDIVASNTYPIRFGESRQCLQEEFLNKFISIEKIRLQNEWKDMIKDKLQNQQLLLQLEEQIIDNLSGDTRIMNDLAMAKKLNELKKEYDETQESQVRVEIMEENIMKARESYRPIALRAAVCFQAANQMHHISLLYLNSFQQALRHFQSATLHSERTAMKAVIDRLTISSYQDTLQSLRERDKPIYTFLLALEICDSHNQIGIGMREFIISPSFGSSVVAEYHKTRRMNNSKMLEAKYAAVKKPFEWMSDEAFSNLQSLAAHFDWFQEMFERMPKDGREMAWRNLVDNEQPENAPLPDKMDEVFSPAQRLCLVRAVRPDRLQAACYVFATSILGKRISSIQANLSIASKVMLNESHPHKPIMLLYDNEVHIMEKSFQNFCQKSKTSSNAVLKISEWTPDLKSDIRNFLFELATASSFASLYSSSTSLKKDDRAPTLLTELSSTNMKSDLSELDAKSSSPQKGSFLSLSRNTTLSPNNDSLGSGHSKPANHQHNRFALFHVSGADTSQIMLEIVQVLTELNMTASGANSMADVCGSGGGGGDGGGRGGPGGAVSNEDKTRGGSGGCGGASETYAGAKAGSVAIDQTNKNSTGGRDDPSKYSKNVREADSSNVGGDSGNCQTHDKTNANTANPSSISNATSSSGDMGDVVEAGAAATGSLRFGGGRGGGGAISLANIRCFISADVNVPDLPVFLMQNCIKLMIESPLLIRDCLYRNLSNQLEYYAKLRSQSAAGIVSSNTSMGVGGASTAGQQAVTTAPGNPVSGALMPLPPIGGAGASIAAAATSNPSVAGEVVCLLHHLCLMHALIKFRSRFQLTGFSAPAQIMSEVSEQELDDAVHSMIHKLDVSGAGTGGGGGSIAQMIPWQYLRYLIAEVFYGSACMNTYDQLTLGSIVDYWISTNSIRKDFELAKVKYKLPAILFNANAKINNILQAIESVSLFIFQSVEACHLHSSTELTLGDDQYIFTRLNYLYDFQQKSETLIHPLFQRPITPRVTPSNCNINAHSDRPIALSRGVYASAALLHQTQAPSLLTSTNQLPASSGQAPVAPSKNKDIYADLWEVCAVLLAKCPKILLTEYIQEKLKKSGGPNTPFNSFLLREFDFLFNLIRLIRSTLENIRHELAMLDFGDQLSRDDCEAVDALLKGYIPGAWLQFAAPNCPPAHFSALSWMAELTTRSQHLERLLGLGKERTPAYNLSAFQYPRTLLAMLRQESQAQLGRVDRSGNFDEIIFHTELTSRDKDHLRDPPSEGFFVYGVYLSGCGWDKSSAELLDSPNKYQFTNLPVIHITCVPSEMHSINNDPNKNFEYFQCPVFFSKAGRNTDWVARFKENNIEANSEYFDLVARQKDAAEPIMSLSLHHDGIPSSRWSLRGVHLSLKPY